MEHLEIIRVILASIGDLQLRELTPLEEKITVSSTLTISTGIVTGRQETEPETGSKFLLFKPRALRRALRDAVVSRKRKPVDVIGQIAPEWLSVPTVEGSESERTATLAYETASSRVVDWVETNTCGGCNGMGNCWSEVKVPIKVVCLRCSGTGFVTKDGSAFHGDIMTHSGICLYCKGEGMIQTGTTTESVKGTCGRCNGSGENETIHYKNLRFYRTFHVATTVSATGKEKVSKFIRHLRRYTGAEELSLESLFEVATTKAREESVGNSRVKLRYTLAVPFSRYEVSERGKTLGILYGIESEGSTFYCADYAFLDRQLNRKRKLIARMSAEEFLNATEQDGFLRYLFQLSQRSSLPEFNRDMLAWLFTERMLLKTIATVAKTAKKRKGFFSRFFG